MPQHSHDDICKRISLNLPASAQWSWDYAYDTALVVIDKCHMDLVYLPITLEFDNQWDFTTIENSPPAFYNYLNRVFGIVPGQKIFTSTGATGTILFAVWWPWGDGQKISLRVGLYDSTDVVIDQDQLREALKSWFRIKDQPLADQLANHLGVRPEQLPHFKEKVIPRLKKYTKAMYRKKVRQNDADGDSATYSQFIIDNVFIDEFENHPYIRSVTDEDNRTILLPRAKDVVTQMISAWRSEVVTEEKRE